MSGFDALPEALRGWAGQLLALLRAQGLDEAAARAKILAPENLAWLIETMQDGAVRPPPQTMLHDAGQTLLKDDWAAREKAERRARGMP